MIRSIILALVTGFGSGEKLKIVDRIHNYGLKYENSPAPPTMTPPLPYKENFLFQETPTCLETQDEIFKYKICLLTNFTQTSISQFDQSSHVLGVFAGFSVENYRFNAINFKFGDLNGCSTHRAGKVFLKCGPEVILSNITEPETCVYHGILQHPAACDDDRLVVYPLLSTEGQATWDEIASDHVNGFLTRLGYDRALQTLLIREGLQTDDVKIEQSAEFKAANAKSIVDSECAEEIAQLKSENIKLRSDLATCYSQNMDMDDPVDFDPMF